MVGDRPWFPPKVNQIKIYNRTDGGTAHRIKEFQIVALDEKGSPTGYNGKENPNPDHVASVPLPSNHSALNRQSYC